jgi:hypothetical protein
MACELIVLLLSLNSTGWTGHTQVLGGDHGKYCVL